MSSVSQIQNYTIFDIIHSINHCYCVAIVQAEPPDGISEMGGGGGDREEKPTINRKIFAILLEFSTSRKRN